MQQSRGVVILGSTGSVGMSTLDVLSRHPDRYRVVALSANDNVDALFQQCQAYTPAYAVMVDAGAASRLQRRLRQAGLNTEVLSEIAGLNDLVHLDQADVVMAAIVGAAGLLPALNAVRAGKRVLIANKEPLVMLGGVFVDEARKSGATILPIDSEHNAIFQCLPLSATGESTITDNARRFGVTKIILTASGGPFREYPVEALDDVTPEQACSHPNWDMGRKVSVDSATMMNKGLEIIEASWLFGLQAQYIEVVIHPQSIVHSLVEYVDGSVLAQLGSPDMRIPIAHALAWPERMPSGAAALDLCELGKLDFQTPDAGRFPCLEIAQEVATLGGTAPAIVNAGNEVAVNAFLKGQIRFSHIAGLIRATLDHVPATRDYDLESVLDADRQARSYALEQVAKGLSGDTVSGSRQAITY